MSWFFYIGYISLFKIKGKKEIENVHIYVHIYVPS